MAVGDFADLYGKAIQAAQRDSTVTYDVTRAKSAVNQAYLSLCDSGPQWSFLATQGSLALTQDDPSYTYTEIATALSVPSINEVLSWNFNGAAGSHKAHYLPWEDFQAVKQLDPSLAAGTPSLWTSYGDSTVEVWPKPTSGITATVLALRGAAELTADGDVPLVPLAWRFKLLVPAAAAILLREEGGEAVAEAQQYEALYFKEWENAQQALVLRLPVPQPSNPPVLLPTGLLGASNQFLGVVQQVCYEANLRVWDQYDLSRAKAAVNQVYRSILDSDDEWDFLEREGQITLTASQDTYTVASIATALSVGKIRQIRYLVHDESQYSGNGGLEGMSWQDLESLTRSTQDNESTGTPVAFAQWDGKIRVWPSPNVAYTLGIYYQLGTTELTSNSDTFLVPDEWLAEVVVPLAAARVLQQGMEPEKIQKASILEARGQLALKSFQEARGSAKWPTLRLESPRFSGDLPGSYVEDWYL